MNIRIALTASVIIVGILTDHVNALPLIDQQVPQPAQTVIINADIHTSNPKAPHATSVAIKDGRFLAVGTENDMRPFIDTDTRILDLNGKTVLPGFIDSHTHLASGLQLLRGVDLSYINNKAEWLKLIKMKAENLPVGAWIVGGNWDYTLLKDKKLPTKEELDTITPNNPVFLRDIDGHSAWVNSLAIKLANIKADTNVPPGGKILIETKTGEPSGILLEGAMQLVSKLDGIAPSNEERRATLLKAITYANSLGITTVHEMASINIADEYLALMKKGQLSLRVWFGTYANSPDDIHSIAKQRSTLNQQAFEYAKKSKNGPNFQLGFLKLWIDGVLSTHTALLNTPYSDRSDTKGEPFMPFSDLQKFVSNANKNGFPLAIHAIGDGGVTMALNAFETASKPIALQNRIEHVEVLDPKDISRFKSLNIAASMQPNHATGTIGKYITDRIGPKREKSAYTWQSINHAGISLAFGSDWPTSPLSPLVQINDAVFRESPFGLGDGPWYPDEALNFNDSLYAYTQAGANMTDWAKDIGSIEVGKWADFIVLAKKISQPIDPSIKNITVSATYIAGKKIYER
jgi:predicted amidohydrolase YtcJ